MYKKLITFLKQLFCRHKYRLVDQEEVFPAPPPGGKIVFVRDHVCGKCGKVTPLGSGWIC